MNRFARTIRTIRSSSGATKRVETLVETLASVLLTGLVVVALLGGLLSALRAATTQRTVANAEVAARNYVKALSDAPYIACATPAFYENPAGFDPVSGTQLRVTSVQGWVRDSEPATFAPFETGCFDDTGLQEVTFEVDGPGSGDHLVRRVLKRYDGNSDGLVGAPVPGDAVRCTVEAAADTTVDAGNPTSSFGTDDSMTLGTGGSGEQDALVRFDINPGSTSCLEGGTLPGGLQVQGATLRFFTSRIVGSPDCGTSCWHVVEQVEDSWSESTTWSTRPSLLAGASTGTVEHGTGTGDSTPRYQLLSTRELTDQVSTFYRLPDLNHGWLISRACAPAHPEHTCDTARFLGVPCGGAGNGQSVLRTRKGEIRFTDQHPVCIQVNSAATNNPVNIWTCDQQPDDNNPSNTHQQFEYTSGGQLKIVGGTQGCAESLGDGRTVYLKACDPNNQAQLWDEEIVDDTAFPVQQISNVQTGSCLEYPVSGSKAVSSPCAGPDATRQGFVWFGNGHIRRSASINQCLKADGSGNDSTISWTDCDGTKNEQLWDRTDRGDGSFRLSTRQSGNRCIEGAWDARDVKLRDCSGSSDWQGWKFEAQADSRTIVQARNALDNTCIDVPNGIQQGSNAYSLPCDPDTRSGQAFVEYRVGTGLLELRFRDDPAVCLDVNGDGATGKNLLAWNCNRGNSQRFRTPGDTLQILSSSDVSTGRCEGYDDASGAIKSQTCQYVSSGGPPIDRQIFRREAIGTTGPSQAVSLRVAAGGGTCVDIDANTATGYSQNTGLTGFPCLGTWRNNQAFVISSNGLVRSAVTPSLCLDANGGGNGSTLLLFGCDSNNHNQIWKFDAGRLRNLRGSTLSRCVTLGGDGTAVTTRDCTTGADQQIASVPFGSAPRAGAVGRIRQSNDCLEANQLPASNNTPAVWSYPCSTSRIAQQVIQLDNGQFRARNDTTRCLDAYHGRLDEGLKFDQCHTPATSNPQQTFDLAGTLRSRATDAGVRRCVTNQGLGAMVLQKACGGSAQDWYFEVVA